jgi:beta-glucosidase
VNEQTGGLPLYVTENGCAIDDRLTADGTRVHDTARVDYLRSHFRACARAIEAGVPLAGYYLWSLIDNFEWAFGYTRRFGVIFCDYTDLRRVPKDSYYFYREVIAGNEPI